MKRREFVLAAGVARSLAAQAGKPDLSGHWIMDQDKSELGTKMRAGGYYEEMVITHREPMIRIDYRLRFNGETIQTVYDLTTDGSETRTKTPIGEEFSVTRWEGVHLVTDSRMPGAESDTTRIVRFLSDDGKFLCVRFQKRSRKPGTMYFRRRG